MARVGDPLDRILGRLADHGAEAIDLNLACDAHTIRACEAGSALFADFAALCRVVTEARRCWPGLLTVKLRLGRRAVDWQARFAERLRLFAETGLDAVIVHPRFFEDKFRRRAQHELIPWIASLTALPLIVNGDLAGPAHVAALAEPMRAAAGIMIGRMALVRPWLFAAWDRPFVVDHAAVWHRLCDYISEDFPPETALRRVKMFTKYFAANFAFGHSFAVCVANAATLPEAVRRADDFFARSPQLVAQPTVAGI
jgi:tRNA-dihydrouridine synthase